jgi:hypothetical protein
MPRRFPKWAGGALLLVSALLTLVTADLALRALAWRWLYPRSHDLLYQNQWPPMPLTPRFVGNAAYENDSFGDLASLVPDKSVRVGRHIVFTTDKHGFRNPPHASERPVELLLLGDSFAAGDGTTQDQTWAELLRKKGRSVYALGVSSSPWQQYMTFELMLGQLRTGPGTTVVWTLFPGNDLDEPYHDMMVPSALPWNGPISRWQMGAARHWKLSPLRQLWMRALAKHASGDGPVILRWFDRRAVLFYKDYVRSLTLTPEKVAAYWSYPRLAHVMHAMKTTAAARGLRLKVFIVPMKEEVYQWLLEGKEPWTSDPAPAAVAAGMLELCRGIGLDCVDMKPEFLRASREVFEKEKGFLYWPDDSHWNANGHALAAEIVEGALKA